MEARMSTWAHVKIGRHIRSKEGVTYKVVANGKGHWGLVDREGNEKIIPEPPVTAPVPIFFMTQDELEVQIAEQLGPNVYLDSIKRPEDSIFVCRPFDTLKPRDMISHCKMMHREYVGDAGAKTAKAIIEAHNEFHEHPKDRWVPHIHADRLKTANPFDNEPLAQEVRP